MKALLRGWLLLALALSVIPSGSAWADHGSSDRSWRGNKRPRAICAPGWGCYYRKGKRGRGFRLFLGFGGFSLGIGVGGGYYPYYGYGYGYPYYGGYYGYPQNFYGPFPPGDYRNGYVGLFGRATWGMPRAF